VLLRGGRALGISFQVFVRKSGAMGLYSMYLQVHFLSEIKNCGALG
jgi:hypothetical protein